MAIVFPASPSVNETFTAGSITYKWDGDKWIGLGVTPADRLIEGSNSLEINASNELVWTGGTSKFGGVLQGDQRVVINGAGGKTGTANTLINYAGDATTVTASLTADGNLGLGSSISSGVNTNLHVRQANAGADIGIRVQNHTTTDDVGGVPTTASLYLSTTTGTFDTARIQVARTDGDLRFGYGSAAGDERLRVFSPPSSGSNGSCILQVHDGVSATNSEALIAVTTGYPAGQVAEGTVQFGAKRAGSGNRGGFIVKTVDSASNTMTTKFQVTDSGSLQLNSRGDKTTSGIIPVNQFCISKIFTNLGTTNTAMDDGVGYGNAGIFTVGLENVDGDECVFQISTGRDQGVAHKYNLISGSNANCSVSNSGGNGGVFTISGLGDGRTYTLTFSNSTLDAPNLRASSAATTGTTQTRLVIFGYSFL